MKSICLIRHAKSSWDDEQAEDFERLLNARGREDAPKMGQRLFASGFKPQLIISSPAFRASSTARRLSRELAYNTGEIVYERRIYDAHLNTLINCIHEIPDSIRQVALVGHNPGMHQLSEWLTNQSIGEFPTCAVAWIDFSIKSWKEINAGAGVLKLYDYPKKNS